MTRNEAIKKMRTLAAVVPSFSEATACWLETATLSTDQTSLITLLADELRRMRQMALKRRLSKPRRRAVA